LTQSDLRGVQSIQVPQTPYNQLECHEPYTDNSPVTENPLRTTDLFPKKPLGTVVPVPQTHINIKPSAKNPYGQYFQCQNPLRTSVTLPQTPYVHQ